MDICCLFCLIKIMSKNQKGIAHLGLLAVIVVVLAVIGFAGWKVYGSNKKSTNQSTSSTAKTTANAKTSNKTATPPTPTTETWTRTGKMVLANVTSTDTHKLADGTYRTYYMNNGQIVYADSTDAVSFGTPKATGVTQDPNMMIANPSVLKIKTGDWIMVYEEQLMNDPNANKPGHMGPQRNFYLATSKDGMSFTKVGMVLDSSKSDGYFASVPNLVLMPNGKVRLYYVCGGQAICARVSSDEGRTWTKEAFSFNIVAGDPDVLYQNGMWVMYYTKLLPDENGLFKAYSTDGLKWTALSGQVVKKTNANGVIVDPDVVQTSTNHYTMFFGEAPNNNSQLNLYSATYAGNIF